MGSSIDVVKAAARPPHSQRNRAGLQLGAGDEFVEELYVGARCAVQALDLRVGGFDYVVFVGSVGAAAVAEAKVAGGEAEWVAGEDVAGPRAGVARQEHGIDAVTAIDGVGDANHFGVGRRAGGIVPAAHLYFDIGKTFFGKMRFQRGERFGGGHIRDEAHVDFGDGAAGENGLSPGAGVAADQSFNIHRGPRDEKLESFLPAYVVDPVIDSEQFFCVGDRKSVV